MTRRESRLRKDLRCCTGDGVTHAFMVGLGETNLPLFALALGKDGETAALVATLPQLAGALVQMFSPWVVRACGSARKFIMVCALIQGLSFIPLVVAAVLGEIPTWMLFAIASVYWSMNLGAAPPWNTWVGALFPERIRIGYFARRSRHYQMAVIASLIAATLILSASTGDSDAGDAALFGAVFALAGACRLWSIHYLRGQGEVAAVDYKAHRDVPIGEFVTRTWRGADAQLLVALCIMNAAVQIGMPLITPYLSCELRLSDGWILTLIGASFGAKSLIAPYWGRFAEKHGARRLLLLGAAGVVPIPLLWLLSDNVAYLLSLQAITGAMFGAWELAAFLLILERVREEERTSMLSTYILINSLASAIGGLAGAALLRADNDDLTGYELAFLASAAARLLAMIPLKMLHVDVRRPTPLATVAIAMRPSAGSIEMPAPASMQQSEARK